MAWQWSVNGVDDATTQSISASQNGNYQVEVTNEFGCISMSDVIEVEESNPNNVFVNSWSTLRLYPNPTTNIARLELPQGVFNIGLYDVTGTLLRTFTNQQGMVIIERESLASGVYQVQLSSANATKSVRLVIE